MSGEICAEWNVIEFIRRRNKLLVLLFIIAIFIRASYTNEQGGLMLDLICVPMMIPCVLKLCANWTWLGNILKTIGKHTTTMWLAHSFVYMYDNWPNRFFIDGVIGWIAITILAFYFAMVWDNTKNKLEDIVINKQ